VAAPNGHKIKANGNGHAVALPGPLPVAIGIIRRIGTRIAFGMPLDAACAAEEPPLTVRQWQDACQDERVKLLCLQAQGQMHEAILRGEVQAGRGYRILQAAYPSYWAPPETRPIEPVEDRSNAPKLTPEQRSQRMRFIYGRLADT